MAQALGTNLLSVEEIKKQYPIHLCVWNNDYDSLKEILNASVTQVS